MKLDKRWRRREEEAPKPLPKGGPDRFRLCLWYADALDKGKDHAEALRDAQGMIFLHRMYVACGIGWKLGKVVGWLPNELYGEEWPKDEVAFETA